MKNFNITLPQKKDFCLCSVLQAILREFNLEISQDEIADNLTSCKEGFKGDDEKIVSFLKSKKIFYEYFSSYNTPFNEPDELLKEMNENYGIVGINDHAYILKNFKDPELELIDPNNSHTIKKNLSNLITEMRKTNGLFGLLKPIF